MVLSRSDVRHGRSTARACTVVSLQHFGRCRNIRCKAHDRRIEVSSTVIAGRARRPRSRIRRKNWRCCWRSRRCGGASYSFIKIGVETIPPVTLIAARTFIAGLILAAIIRWRGLSLPKDATTWRRFLFQACLNSVVPFTLIAWAQQTTDAALATILNSTSPHLRFPLDRARHAP